jgi:hypothetical protein
MSFLYTDAQVEKYGRKNLKELIKTNATFAAIIMEHMSAKEDGHILTSSHNPGYDHYDPKTGERVEVKVVNIHSNEYIRMKGIVGKENRFDTLKIIDRFNQFVSKIPHDEFYKKADLANNEFLYSPSLNSQDKRKVKNTNLVVDWMIHYV